MRSLIATVLSVATLLSVSSSAFAQGAQPTPPAGTPVDPSTDASADPWPNSQHGIFLSTYDATRLHESMARAGTLPSVSSQRRIAQWPALCALARMMKGEDRARGMWQDG